MAQHRLLVNALRTKINSVTTQKDELHDIIDKYVDQAVALGKAVIDEKELDLNKFQETDSRLETCWRVLLQKCVEIEDITSNSSTVSTESHLSRSASSLSQSALPSTSVPQTSSDSGPVQRQGAIDDIQSLKEKLDNLQTNIAEVETRQTTRCNKMEEEIRKLKTADKNQEKSLDRGEEQLKQQDTRLSSLEKNVKQAETKLIAMTEEVDSRVMTAVDQKLNDLQEKHANTNKKLSSRVNDMDRELKDMARKNAEVFRQTESKHDSFAQKIERVEADGRRESSRMDNLEGEVQILKSQYSEIEQSSRVENLEGEVKILKRQYNEIKQSSKLQTHKEESKRSTSQLSSQQKGQVEQQVSNTSVQAAAPQTPEKLLFHPRCGQNVEVINNNRTAQKIDKNCWDKVIVMTCRSLQENEVFEIQLDKLYSMWYVSIMIGVTTQQPSELNFPGSMFYIKSNIWMIYGNTVYHNGSVIVKNYGQDLNRLKAGDRVGVVRKPDGTIHLFVNGTDQGVCATNVPPNPYGIFDLFEMAVQVSIVDK